MNGQELLQAMHEVVGQVPGLGDQVLYYENTHFPLQGCHLKQEEEQENILYTSFKRTDGRTVILPLPYEHLTRVIAQEEEGVA
jgi:hypothetical protein